MIIRYPDRVEELGTVPNTGDSQLFDQALAALKRGLPELAMQPVRPEPAILCGGGPSLGDEATLDLIAKLQAMGGKVFALNNSAKLLAEHGIRADFQVVLDAREQNAEFVRFDRADTLLLATQCHESVFETALARGAKLLTFTHGTPAFGERLKKELGRTEGLLMMGGSHTVGLVSMCVAYALGFSRMDLFGYDSCHRDNRGHAYAQPLNANDDTLTVTVDGRVFTASIAMTAQARAFPDVAQSLANLDCEIHVHGDGLLPHIAKLVEKGQNEKPLTAIYDLAAAPGTWEFATFLSEAERYRVDHGLSCIDVLFSPGPMWGFRNDGLPPSVEHRQGMMQRICLPLCHMLPSVRNITVLREKLELPPAGELFPPTWTPEFPATCYGPEHLHDGNPVFRATPVAQMWQKQRFDQPYVTITMREAAHWPGRNSNRPVWEKAAAWLKAAGYEVVVVPDIEGGPLVGYTNCYEASWDPDLRMALYEGATLNLGVSNGPLVLCYLSKVPYLIFKLLPQDGSPITEAFYQARGLVPGAQWTPNGKVVWEVDSEELVLKEIAEFFTKKEIANVG